MVVATRRESPSGPEECGTRELWSLEAAVPLATSPAPAGAIAAASQDAGVERPAARLGKWIRDRVRRSEDELALPPLREPARPAIAQLRRGRLEAAWSARRARLELGEFLRERLGRYLAKSGIDGARLPVAIDVDSGRVVAAPRSGGAATPEWLAPYVRAHGAPALAADLERARAEAARAETALEEARERLTLARHELEAAARAPSLAWSDGDAASPDGRPAVPPPWSVAIAAFIAAMVLGNAWQLALPLLAASGISPAELAAEASRRPEAVALPMLLALGASACLFIFSALAVRRARALMESLPPRWHAAVHALAGALSLVMAVGLAWAILVRGAAAAGRGRDVTSFLVAMALPLATPPLVSLARRLHASRAEKARAAAAWDHVHRAAVAQWTRTNALASTTERECAALEATRAAWAQRYHLLRVRVAEVERLAADAADAEAAELRQLSEVIVRALEADRRAYLAGGRHPPAPARAEPLPEASAGAVDAP